VVLYATLGRYHPQGRGIEPFTVKLPTGSTVAELLEHLQIAEGEAKQTFIEYASRPRDYTLQGGQKVAVFPPIAGG
jgi:molybdopterin converting factor small subunit